MIQVKCLKDEAQAHDATGSSGDWAGSELFAMLAQKWELTWRKEVKKYKSR